MISISSKFFKYQKGEVRTRPPFVSRDTDDTAMDTAESA